MAHTVQQQTGEKLMPILVFTLVLSVMTATMFNIVLPEIASDLQLSMAQVSWVSSVYMLIYGIGTVIYGKLADSYKLKNLLTYGLIIFALGSLVGLTAQDYWMVLLARILQAIGAAVFPATAMIIPVRYFPREKRGRALGMVAAGLALGRILAPIAPAFILSIADWRWLFCLPLLSLFLLPFYRKYLQDEKKNGGKMDWIGSGLLGGTVALLLLSVTEGGWLSVIGGLILLVLFIVRICVVEEPFVQPSLFQNKRYSLGLLITFLVSGAGFSFVFLSPLLLADVHQLSSALVGFAMVPAAVTSAILARKGGKLADIRGNAFLFYLSSTLMLISFLLLSSFAGLSPNLIAVVLILGDVGAAFILISLSNSVSRMLTKEQTGVGMGIFQMLNFIAGAVAGSIYGKVVDSSPGHAFNPMNAHPDALVYSNIYVVLAVLFGGILWIFFRSLAERPSDIQKYREVKAQ